VTNKEAKRRIESASKADGRRLHTDYSGRGMYGNTCWGITCGDPEDVIAEVGVKGARRDCMGRRTIIYWPAISGEREEPSDE
jgi:hypothetical protein